MTLLSCKTARGQLQAYHDDELPVQEQISVGAHVDGCEYCREALADIEGVGDWLRSAAPGHAAMSCDEAASFVSTVVNRAKVEDAASLLTFVREMFDDRRFVYSGLGATGATLACLIIMLGMMRFGVGGERTDSLAGMMNLLASPVASEQVVVIRPRVMDARVIMPRALDSYSDSDVGDSVLALSGVVTTEGRVSNIEVNDGSGGIAMASMDAKRLESLVEAVSRTRFEPVMKEGEAVPVNMVWFVAHTTVRGVGRRHLGGPQLGGLRKRIV